MNLSVDNRAEQIQQQLGQVGHMKQISMNGLPYEKVKGHTPVNNKASSQLKNYTDNEDTRNFKRGP
jgi:hypothetical protein